MKRLIVELEKEEITIQGEKSCPKGETRRLSNDEILGMLDWARRYTMHKIFHDREQSSRGGKK